VRRNTETGFYDDDDDVGQLSVREILEAGKEETAKRFLLISRRRLFIPSLSYKKIAGQKLASNRDHKFVFCT
jgi:hypothetical protein